MTVLSFVWLVLLVLDLTRGLSPLLTRLNYLIWGWAAITSLKTPEGRLLCLLLATYGFAIFGCVTATVASYFVARDADTDDGEIAGAKQLDALRREIERLRHAVEGLSSSGHAP
jgi:hypothetical protein